MKSFRELTKYFKNINNCTIDKENQVILYKNDQNYIAYIYLSKKNLKNPYFILNTLDKYKEIKKHVILTYVGFSPKIFKIDFLDINFDIQIDISGLPEMCCLGLVEFKTSLLYMKKIGDDTYNKILEKIADEIKKQQKIYKVIPYGLESDITIYTDLKKYLNSN